MRTSRQNTDASIINVDLISCGNAISRGYPFSLSEEEQFILIDIDPAHVYAFWRLRPNSAALSLGQLLVLRIISLEGLCLTRTVLPEDASSCYVDLPPNVTSCLAQIGYELADGSFVCTAASNEIHLPVLLSPQAQSLPAQIDAVASVEPDPLVAIFEEPPIILSNKEEERFLAIDGAIEYSQPPVDQFLSPPLLPTARESVAYELVPPSYYDASSWLVIGSGL